MSDKIGKLLYLLISLTIINKNNVSVSGYLIGIGIADCTGPSAEIGFMGYAKIKQLGCGIHLRQYSRAFIIDDGSNRVVFVSVDTAMICYGIHREVLNKLNTSIYTVDNVIISGTHTHSTLGGFLMDLMYDIPNKGFVRETFEALVNGIIKSILRAEENLVKGRIFLNKGILLEANINRSPASYLLNPQNERDRYEYDVDKEMIQLKFVSLDDRDLGVINWFAVHATSMNNTNCLVSSDNVGYASVLMENHINNATIPGTGPFVAAFASSNLGDVSPNIKGAICVNTGKPCDFVTSTCDGRTKFCRASGPGNNMFESTKIIAKRLYNKGVELFDNADSEEIFGPVKFVHQFVDMTKENVTIDLLNGTKSTGYGCFPAMGYSFAAGTTDGPGEFDFSQGTLTDNPFWNGFRSFISSPTKLDIACHHPKPILLNTGKANFPYPWQTHIVSTQIVLVGNVALLAVPGEFTTMSGRRLREKISETFALLNNQTNITPIIVGLSNFYTNYITTFEEYQLQRYEGASTIFGPHTLNIYLKKYKQLSEALIRNSTLYPGPTPPDFTSKLITLVTPVLYDYPGLFKKFGSCLLQPPSTVKIGETVTVKFASGHPRNNLMHDKSFLYVEKWINKKWIVVATDANWDTKFYWKRKNILLGESEAIIEWYVDDNNKIGLYRIKHNGYYKTISGKIRPYSGHCNPFYIKK